MSFNNFDAHVQEGDSLILYISVTDTHSIKAVKTKTNKNGKMIDNVMQTTYGALNCGELIGKPFGSKVKLSRGFGYILRPTCELWSVTLPHRTQIIYTPDISMILLQLEIGPGKVVVESGTGSGSLSHSLIRAVKPTGHLHTFDFHEGRVLTATEEFAEHGFADYVTVSCRDVCTSGFGDEITGKADAVFLDLPHPWLAVPHAAKALNPQRSGRICSFSPCIEQVQKSCAALSALGCDEIETMEVLQTQYNVQAKTLSILELEYLRSEKDSIAGGGATLDAAAKKSATVWTTVPPVSQPGHTGYLTFATLPPDYARNVVDCELTY